MLTANVKGHWKDRIPKHLPPVQSSEEEIQGFMLKLFGMVSEKLKEDWENHNNFSSGVDRGPVCHGDRPNHLHPQNGKEGTGMFVKGSCLRLKADGHGAVDPLVVHIDGDIVYFADEEDQVGKMTMAEAIENYVELDRLYENEVGDYSEEIAEFKREHGE